MARRRLTPANSAPPHSGLLHRGGAPSEGLPRNGPPIARVAGQSAEAAALREITEGLAAARATGRMIVEVPLSEIAPGYVTRDRVRLDTQELGALKASIRVHGQRSPAEITPLTGPAARGDGPEDEDGPDGAVRWGLISGWRRMTALSELFAETGEARFATLRALVRPPEEAANSYVAMVEENEVRVGLSYYERARVVAEAAARGVFEDQSAALRSLFATASRAKRSKIGSFIDIHEALGDVLRFPAEIPERLGLQIVSRLRRGERTALRQALVTAKPADAASELAVLDRLVRAPQPRAGAGAGTTTDRAAGAQAPDRAEGGPGPAPGEEQLRDGVAMRLTRTGDGLTVTLSGPGVDAELATAVRAALRRQFGQG